MAHDSPARGICQNGTLASSAATIEAHGLCRWVSVAASVDGALERFGLGHIDVIYRHRPDPHTRIEETGRAMSAIIGQGKALTFR